MDLLLLVGLAFLFCVAVVAEDELEVVLVKIGGSSITQKAERESLDHAALEWFAHSVSREVSPEFLGPSAGKDKTLRSKKLAFVIVHGAGSFGHHSAKDHGLKGHSEEPTADMNLSTSEKRFEMQGIAETRLSVQTLNRHVVKILIKNGVNAVGISPCFGIPGLEAHAGQQQGSQGLLEKVVKDTVNAGLVPVLHGDACLYGSGGGILSGDTIMEILGRTSWVHHAVFITDVDGVYTKDPRINPDAELLRTILVDEETGDIATQLDASTSSHTHDVTGGLAVSLPGSQCGTT